MNSIEFYGGTILEKKTQKASFLIMGLMWIVFGVLGYLIDPAKKWIVVLEFIVGFVFIGIYFVSNKKQAS